MAEHKIFGESEKGWGCRQEVEGVVWVRDRRLNQEEGKEEWIGETGCGCYH